jgi:integral membrane sensor domain MASE1
MSDGEFAAPAAPERSLWRRPDWPIWFTLTGLGLAAAYVAMAEVASVVSDATPTGGTTLSALFGIGQLTSLAEWATTIQTLNAWAGAVHQLSLLSPHDLVLWLSCPTSRTSKTASTNDAS